MRRRVPWITVLAAGAGAVSIAYFLYRIRLSSVRKQIVLLETEIREARMREEEEKRKLHKVFEALASLQETTNELLRDLREKIRIRYPA